LSRASLTFEVVRATMPTACDEFSTTEGTDAGQETPGNHADWRAAPLLRACCGTADLHSDRADAPPGNYADRVAGLVPGSCVMTYTTTANDRMR
jgi:hypothetical protein